MHDTDSIQQLVQKTAAQIGLTTLQTKASQVETNVSINPLKTLFKQGSRLDTLTKGLGQIMPEFHTNHRAEDGGASLLAIENDHPANALLVDVLKQLHTTAIQPSEPISRQRTSSAIKPRPLTGLERIQNEYAIEKTLGEGSFGKVKLGIHIATGKKVAIKCLEKSTISKNVGTSERLLREIVLLSHLNHPNICKLLQVIDSPSTIFLIMEYEAGGELFDVLIKSKKLSEDAARYLFRQMLCAIQYCHRLGIVHRDLKPENLMLDEFGNVKLIDFGFANVVRENKMETFCGSAAYAAPEMIGNKKYHGCETDAWALGVILFVLVCGEMPFDDKHMSRMYVAIMSGKYKNFPPEVSSEFKDLVTSILKVKPHERATLQAMRSHPWTTHGGTLPPVHFCETSPTCTVCNYGFTSEETKEFTAQLIDMGYSATDIQQAFKNQYPSSACAALCILSKNSVRIRKVMSQLGVFDERFTGSWTRIHPEKDSSESAPPPQEDDTSTSSSSKMIMEEAEENTDSLSERQIRPGSAYRKGLACRRKNLELAADALLVKLNDKKTSVPPASFDI